MEGILDEGLLMEYNNDKSIDRNKVDALISIANSLEKLPSRLEDIKHTMESMKVISK